MTEHPQTATSPSAMLTDAIGRLAVLETRHTDVASDVSELHAAVQSAADAVRQLQAQLDQMSEVETAEDDQDDESAIVDWSRLDRDTARVEWDRLEQWVSEWLVPTYEITIDQIPVCWQHHPAMREQLSWLRAAWAGVYRTSRGSGAGAGEWHSRWLPAALEAIKSAANAAQCSTAGKHRDVLISEDARVLRGTELSTVDYWDREGRELDLAARPSSPDPDGE